MDWVQSFALAGGIVVSASIIAWTFAPQGWRTVVANALATGFTAMAPVIETLAAAPWHELFDKKTAVALAIALGAMNAFWRKKTSTPIGRR